MQNFTAQSSHTIGYSWNIDAPEGLTKSDIEKLIVCLIDYTDEPNQAQLEDMFAAGEYYYEKLNKKKLDLFKQVKIATDTIHRETFYQEVEKCK